MSCEAAGMDELLSAYRDGETTPSEKERVREHLTACADCRLALKLLEAGRQAFRNAPRPGLPADLAASLRRASPPAQRFGLPLPWIRPAWGLAAAGALAAASLFVYWRQEAELPIDVLVAAHESADGAL